MKQELLENLIRVCAKEILQQINEGKKSKKCKCGKTLIFGSEKCAVCEAKELNENDEGEEDGICGTCNGSGEGMADKTRCSSCGGSGNSKKSRGKKGTPDERDYGDEYDRKKNREDESVNEDETEGSPAPPADGLGTDQQPEIPKDPTDIDAEPSEPETPETPEIPVKKEKLQGVVLYTPSGEMRSVPFRTFADDASIERTLFKVGSSIGGRNTKIAISTFKKVKAGLNDKTPTYIYLGKYDPSSEEPFVFADRDLNVAKEESIKPEELKGDVATKMSPADVADDFAIQNDDERFAAKLAGTDKSFDSYDIEDPNVNESIKLKNYIKKFVTEALSRK